MLIHVDPANLDTAWPASARLLETALAKGCGESTIDQLRLLVQQGRMHLIVEQDDTGVHMAGLVEFKNYPQFRACHVAYVSGRIGTETVNTIKQWAADNGASCLETLCGMAESRLFARYGFTDTYHFMRAPL